MVVQTYGDHISGNIANTASPSLRGLVKDIVNPDTRIRSRKLIQILLEQNILLGDVGKDEVNLSAVTSLATTDNGTDNLQHGSNASTAGNHTEMADHVGRINEGTLGSLDTDGLSDGEAGHVLADVAGGVGLDQEVEVAWLVVTADGSI
jgi:hypothetical protein